MKLLGIDASGVADGVPSVVLNLIWNIILHFQVKEMTRGLHRRLSSSLSSLSVGSELTDEAAPDPDQTTAKDPKYHGKTIRSLLHWVQRCTTDFGVEVHDFGKSWRNGLAFLALIKSIDKTLVDMRQGFTKRPEENLEQAFNTAHQHLDIPPLLEPQDVTCSCPDEKSIITYVSMFLRHCPDIVEDLSTAVTSPHISKFRSLETLADREEAQSVFNSLETSHELLLWKHWARRSSYSTPQSKRKSSSAQQPLSPLDAFVANPDILSWLMKSSDQGYSKTENNEIQFSSTSDEGIYSVTPLDSDEEDAYSYILDLNKDVAQSQAKRQVLRVEEENEEITSHDDEEQPDMFTDAVSDVPIHFNSKEKSEKERNEKSPTTIMDLEISENARQEERNKQKTSVEASKNSRDTQKHTAKNQFQAADDLMLQKAHEKETESVTNRGCFIENLAEDMEKGKADEFKSEFILRHRKKKVDGPRVESKGASDNVSVPRGHNMSHDQAMHSHKTRREVSEGKCKHHESSSITASEKKVLVYSVAPPRGVSWTELHVMLFLWMLLYCYFIVQHIITC